MRDSPPHVLVFEPVVSTRRRHDGWTAERQQAFIAALARIGMVTAAARSVGMSRKSAYALLARAGPDSSFAGAWRAAQVEGRVSAWCTAVARALDGVEVPYFYRGKRCGTRRLYNDRLLLAALQAVKRAQGIGVADWEDMWGRPWNG
jgi:hypothetical protein